MLFSLIISTRGRVTELERLLDSLAQQSVQDFEVIIVDQNDDDRITYLASDARWRGRLFYLKSSEGVSRGRNDGLTRATGEIVTFPDDDCAYPPQLLENVAHFFQSQPRYGVLCGRSYDAEGGDAVALHSLKAEPVSRTKIYAQCIEFAIFIRRTALGETRFDENMGVGATTPWQADEGPDLVLRLQERGVLAYYDPQYGIWHPKRISAWDAFVFKAAKCASTGREFGADGVVGTDIRPPLRNAAKPHLKCEPTVPLRIGPLP
jgi:glycosyltransferase involved in cell wall biosynthesis